MKICFASTMNGAAWGGSEALWCAAARQALQDGHEVATLTSRWPAMPKALDDLRAAGARVFHRARNREKRGARLFEQWVHPLPTLARWRPDVICFSQGEVYDTVKCLDLVRLQERCGAPFVVVCQFNSDTNIPRPTIRSRAVAFFARAHRMVFVAEQNRRDAERQLASLLPNACVVRNPVNLSSVEAVPWPRSDIVHLANVAALNARHKGQDLFFEALSGAEWKARSWRLRLYGSGPDLGYYQQLARHFAIDDRVEFVGFSDDIRRVWADNHMLVLSSRSEGTPLALVEAMLCGRPSVVTDVGGNAEWIEESETGFVADSATVKAIRGALERAWLAKDRWETIGAKARNQALRQYDPTPGATLLKLLTDAANRAVKRAAPPVATRASDEDKCTAATMRGD